MRVVESESGRIAIRIGGKEGEDGEPQGHMISHPLTDAEALRVATDLIGLVKQRECR